MSIIALRKVQQLSERQQFVVKQLPDFLKRMSVLLTEGYTFAHCVSMLLPYHVKQYKKVEEQMERVLKDGGGAEQLMGLFGVEKQYLVAIKMAEYTGDLSGTLAQIAEQMDFQAETRKQFVKVLTYPTLMFVFLIGLFIAFRIYFLPNMSTMVSSRAQGAETSSMQWAAFFLHMPDYFIGFALVCAVILIGVYFYIQRKRVDLQLSILFKIPLVGHFWRLVLTRQFARNLGNLLKTGFSLQQALEHLKNQIHQKQLAYVAEQIQHRVIYGESLRAVVVASGYFYPRFDQFVAHGEASGLLGRELLLYSELLDARIQHVMKLLLAIVQPVMFIIIAVCVVAAYLSILIPMYNLLEFV